MEHRTLGRTGLSVTQLGFGAMELRGPRLTSDDDAARILNAVLDSGINFIDTANCYGRSEELIGKFIGSRRNDYYLSTKCGAFRQEVNGQIQASHVFTRENLLRNIDESLGRLKTDHVDILQLHNPSVEVVEENGIVDVLREIQQSGKTRFISISTTLPHLPGFLEMNCFDTFQIPYSALERAHEDWITRVAEAGSGVIVRGGVGKAEVTNEAVTGPRGDIWSAANMEELLGGMTRMEFQLRFTLSHPHCDTTIVGTLIPKHLKENLAAAAKGPLPADVYEEAKSRLSVEGNTPQ
jgi:aryl-alcohol dehydrogenase-like predicted oxidoreductase